MPLSTRQTPTLAVDDDSATTTGDLVVLLFRDVLKQTAQMTLTKQPSMSDHHRPSIS